MRKLCCGSVGVVLAFTLVAAPAFSAEESLLPKARFLDKCRGALAGQMVAVCYGDPFQFRSNGQPWLGTIPAWEAKKVAGALNQDDCYVELSFLAGLEKHGLDITPEQAGKAFAAPGYALYHANKFGRDNIRRGIMPPLSGHPEHNRHADDIDFMIEADVLGIVCPGLPHESNRLSDVFGHIMNYGDGVYAGMWIAGMYTAAFFEDKDVHAVLQAGLDCVPRESEFHRCITDVLAWHRENPGDWLATWRKIEEKWQDDIDCTPGNDYNIDAKLNAAYVAVGMLYGAGDFMKSIEICVRCGQDADSTAANLGGILGCMKGYDGIGASVFGGVPAIADQPFSHTEYSFNGAVAACQRVAEQVIRRAGGEIRGDAYAIARQQPQAPGKLEQWTQQHKLLMKPITGHEVVLWNPDWEAVDLPNDGDGYLPENYGRKNVLALHPLSRVQPGAIATRVDVPSGPRAQLAIEVATVGQYGPCVMRVLIDGEPVSETLVNTSGLWTTERIDVSRHAGKSIRVQIQAHAVGRSLGALYLGDIAVGAD